MVNSPDGLSRTQGLLSYLVRFGSRLGVLRPVQHSAKKLLMQDFKRSGKEKLSLVAIWIALLPAPRIPTHVFNVASRTPIKQ